MCVCGFFVSMLAWPLTSKIISSFHPDDEYIHSRLSPSLALRSNTDMASIRCLDFDERGWPMLLVPAQVVADGPTRIWRVTMKNKTLEFIEQQEQLKVYVKPEADGFDEWETPPDSGTKALVGSPSPSSESRQCDTRAIRNTKRAAPGGA